MSSSDDPQACTADGVRAISGLHGGVPQARGWQNVSKKCLQMKVLMTSPSDLRKPYAENGSQKICGEFECSINGIVTFIKGECKLM